MQKNRRTVNRHAWMIGMAFCLLTGCTRLDVQRLYEGDIRPAKEIVKIGLPDYLQAEALDGESIHNPYFHLGSGHTELHLLPGSHELALRYVRTWDNDPYGIDRVKSDLIIVHVDGHAGDTYDIRIHASIHSYEDSKRFAAQPSLELIKTSDANASAAIVSDTVKRVEPSAPAESTGGQSNLDILKRTWKNATKAEREAFLKSIVQ